MRIIKNGTLKEYKVICPKCSCEFICNEEEIHPGYLFNKSDTLAKVFKTIYCPYCKKEIKETETEFKEIYNE